MNFNPFSAKFHQTVKRLWMKVADNGIWFRIMNDPSWYVLSWPDLTRPVLTHLDAFWLNPNLITYSWPFLFILICLTRCVGMWNCRNNMFWQLEKCWMNLKNSFISCRNSVLVFWIYIPLCTSCHLQAY